MTIIKKIEKALKEILLSKPKNKAKYENYILQPEKFDILKEKIKKTNPNSKTEQCNAKLNR